MVAAMYQMMMVVMFACVRLTVAYELDGRTKETRAASKAPLASSALCASREGWFQPATRLQDKGNRPVATLLCQAHIKGLCEDVWNRS